MKLTNRSTRLQQGFTLIELIVVIVILGILAATALPKFIDLRGDAAAAAVAGVAGSLSSASAINYGGRLISTNNGVSIADCGHVSNAIAGGLPTGYTITTQTVSNGGVATDCVLKLTGSTPTQSASFTAHGIT